MTKDPKKLESSQNWKKIEYDLFSKTDVGHVVGSYEQEIMQKAFPNKPIRNIPLYIYDKIQCDHRDQRDHRLIIPIPELQVMDKKRLKTPLSPHLPADARRWRTTRHASGAGYGNTADIPMRRECTKSFPPEKTPAPAWKSRPLPDAAAQTEQDA